MNNARALIHSSSVPVLEPSPPTIRALKGRLGPAGRVFKDASRQRRAGASAHGLEAQS